MGREAKGWKFNVEADLRKVKKKLKVTYSMFPWETGKCGTSLVIFSMYS
jgi:hypothetical protein